MLDSVFTICPKVRASGCLCVLERDSVCLSGVCGVNSCKHQKPAWPSLLASLTAWKMVAKTTAQGHSIEQFRFYEAIESGSIPIMAMEGHCPGGCPNYAAERLPAEYLQYPVVVIQDWDTLIATMIELESNQTALLQRQLDLRKWYQTFMHNKITEMEDGLIAKF